MHIYYYYFFILLLLYWRSINIYFTKCKYIIEPQEDKVLNYYFTYTKLLPPRTNNNNHHKQESTQSPSPGDKTGATRRPGGNTNARWPAAPGARELEPVALVGRRRVGRAGPGPRRERGGGPRAQPRAARCAGSARPPRRPEAARGSCRE